MTKSLSPCIDERSYQLQRSRTRSLADDLRPRLRAEEGGADDGLVSPRTRGNNEMADKDADRDIEWFETWIASVASGKATMSQRSITSIETHGGLETAVAAARRMSVHLVQLTDDNGNVLVVASRALFKTLC